MRVDGWLIGGVARLSGELILRMLQRHLISERQEAASAVIASATSKPCRYIPGTPRLRPGGW